MKNSITLVFITLSFLQLNAQKINLEAALPIDKSIKKGVLPNGLTYYIKSTDIVEKAASFYIIQNVGSILENDNQQGLAHFLEHMAFNGTQNFKGKGILNTFQKQGLIFGRDINAYTSFDETVYNINNVPTTPILIDKGLLVLHDWCNYLLLTDEEIDAERGVIKEEWRSRQNGNMRLFKTSLPVTFNHSKYADRLPIGLMRIVENFKYQALRDFYHDWYRTDLQAIAIIGDINVDAIEAKIKSLFSKIPAVKNPRERFVVEIPENDELLYSLGMDTEISTSRIELGIRHKKSLETQTVNSLRDELLEYMATSLVTTRIADEAEKPDAPFLSASINYTQLSRVNNLLSITISPKPNQQQDAFKAVVTELNRAVKYGYTAAEIDRSVKLLLNYYETLVSKKDEIAHGTIINKIKDDYLNNITIIDIVKQYDLVKQLLSNITPEDVHKTIKKLYTKKNRFINVTGVEGHHNLTKAEVNEILNNVENDYTLKPYKDSFEGKTLLEGVDIKEGTITSTINNKALNATTYNLSNGIKVHYKFADKQKNAVSLEAISPGGTSLLNNQDFAQATLVNSLKSNSGVGNYKASDLKKLLTGKTAFTRLNIRETREELIGASTAKDVETLLQLVHLDFVKPRFDKEAFTVLKKNIKNSITANSKNLNSKIRDSIITTLYGKNNPRKLIYDKSYLDKVSFERTKAVYLDRFKNAADFEFFIVGDVKPETIEPLLKKYIASIPTNNDFERFTDHHIQWNADKIDKDIFIAMEDPKTNVNLTYKLDMKYNVTNNYLVRALGDILELRLLDRLREQEGGVYSPRVNSYLVKEPESRAYLSVSFDCNPDLAEKLIAIVHSETSKICKGKIQQEDLDKALTNYRKDRQQNKTHNAYKMSLLKTFYRDGYNLDDPKNFEAILNAISKKDIKKVAKKIVKKGKSYEIVIKPKKV
ncbi:insulinase family protein [Aureibaculum sp. 2210JD6-5]|uniref:M16 family metallopeptidase n=1 Tax=Aureibaculum sp. 2210JD6-5 TaxID=3103957 RepID=UPI002AAE0D78|nr:insulinase family protein [Aureibaculum sp. 2210JD6-5]MDY7396761.1 insulinase family protein [Aureibaculum sp. 2210JD6-5]